MATDKPEAPKTYRALRRTWLSHESRMVEPGEVFTTTFPKVPKREQNGGVVVTDADGRLVVRPDPLSHRKDDKPVMVDMDLGDNLEEVGGNVKPSEPAIGLEHGDKKPNVEEVLKSAQDHIDRQRAQLPSPGLAPAGSGEFQRASDGPATRDTDDDQDGGPKTPAEQRAADQRRAATDPERRGTPPKRG